MAEEVRITDQLQIPASELRWEFAQSSGPGGQNVNKVATAVRLRFDAIRSPSLPEDVRQRLLHLAGRRARASGEILIEARRFRTQAHNRQDAMDRFLRLLRSAARPPKVRRRTRPTAPSRERRLAAKRRRGSVKGLRRPIEDPD
jgi:ribosome-associated protein